MDMMSGTTEQLTGLSGRVEEYRERYQKLVGEGFKLDLTRGKPAPEQLDLSDALLELPGSGNARGGGTDTRNYGGLQGLPELRKIVAPSLQVPWEQLVAGGNSSLNLMHDCLADAILHGVPGSPAPWKTLPRIAFLAPVPGYDRHFTVCDGLGVELIPVPMNDQGPDLDLVERLVAADPAIKGIWSVPKYSNPSGVTYSAETVRRLAGMPTAAADFRIFWDNAYAVHHLTDQPDQLDDVLAACAAAGHPDRVFVFGSTSKVTFAGAGVAFFGSSPANVGWYLNNLQRKTIGPDKVNQLRHAQFLGDEAGLAALMQRHRELLAPKFAAADQALQELAGVATWSKPNGGYFITLQVPPGCARRVVELAGQAGIALTPAGAPFPGGDDPQDSVLRLAPSFPSTEEVAEAMHGVAVCVLLAAAEQASA
jgi:aspartate/methionine/tyrosine aminotransferase